MIKKESIVISLIFVFFTTNALFAQISIDDAKKTTESFFLFCKKNDFQKAAKLLAYNGADKLRLYRDFYNTNNPDEFKEVKRICKKVNATLLISDSYNLGKLRNKMINGKKLQTLDIQFLSGSQKIESRILLIKIDRTTAIFDYN